MAACYIRMLHPADRKSVEGLLSRLQPEPWFARPPWQDLPAPGDPDHAYLVAELEGRVLGYAGGFSQQNGRFGITVVVDSREQRRGVGSRLLDQLLMELSVRDAVLVQARTPDDRPESLSFLLNRRFQEAHRMVHLRLPLTETRPDVMEAAALASRHPDVIVTTLGEEQHRIGNPAPQLCELLQEAALERADPYVLPGDLPDNPESENIQDAAAIAAYLNSYDPVSPEAFFVARCGEQYVGLSFLRAPQGRLIRQGDTAVHREWRRRGIATDLKQRAIEWAGRQSYAAITTSTASAGMLALNERLGFLREWAEVRLVRKL